MCQNHQLNFPLLFTHMWARTLTHSSETLKLATYKARHGGRGCPLWSAGAHDLETPSGTAGWESVAGPCWAFLLQEIHKADRAHQQERAFWTVSSQSCVWESSILQIQLETLSHSEEGLPFPSAGDTARGSRQRENSLETTKVWALWHAIPESWVTEAFLWVVHLREGRWH